jgi:hypothetical protein
VLDYQFLGDWSGHLLVDDYSGYKVLFSNGGCTQLSCWAHVRRKFFDLYQANASTLAQEALNAYSLRRISRSVNNAKHAAQHQGMKCLFRVFAVKLVRA